MAKRGSPEHRAKLIAAWTPERRAEYAAKRKATWTPWRRAALSAALRLPRPSPTALARQMIERGATDKMILTATKFVFGKDAAWPVLFKRGDLKRLRARMKK